MFLWGLSRLPCRLLNWFIIRVLQYFGNTILINNDPSPILAIFFEHALKPQSTTEEKHAKSFPFAIFPVPLIHILEYLELYLILIPVVLAIPILLILSPMPHIFLHYPITTITTIITITTITTIATTATITTIATIAIVVVCLT